ncbi:MAG: CBS domain-containing protein [Proteobacteria bacterium]|nr:CBS domain-containing protein [Pseudomonadota bacterium]
MGLGDRHIDKTNMIAELSDAGPAIHEPSPQTAESVESGALPSIARHGLSLPEGDGEINLGRLAVFSAPITIWASVREAKKRLGEEIPLNALVVVDGDRPVGLIMSLHLDRTLSRQYGIALYYDEPVSKCMDARPLILDAGVSVETAAREAMNREPDHIYDHIVITDRGRLSGMVSIWRIIDTLALLQQRRSAELDRINRRLQAEICEKEKAEKALAARAEELARSNTDLWQFAYFVSHDLQEPLRAIRGFMQLLEQRYKDAVDDKGRSYIARSVAAARRMQGLINDLLAYSRVGTRGLEFETVDLNLTLSAALENLQVAIGDHQAEIVSDPLPSTAADPSQMTRLFQNLIGNAIKFRGDENPRVRISAVQEDGFFHFSVSDQGIGFDPDQAERIFSIFQRLHTRDHYPGTGIGLSICKRIVERHGGKIWAESKSGAGAIFHFTIPVIQGDLKQ